MNTRIALLAIGTLAAAAAFAQTSNIPPELRTSTAGNGCTATGNAMRGGNLGGSPTMKPCGDAGAAQAASVSPAQQAAAAAPQAVAESTSMGGNRTPARAPRADRN